MNKLVKTAIVYLGITLFCVLFSYIYSLFSHGMSSAAMTYLFIVPFALGSVVFVLLYALLEDIAERPLFRLFYNIYNTAVAVLAAGLLLRGIFVIAGSGSRLLIHYYIAAGILFAASVVILCRILLDRRRSMNDK